MIKLDKNKFEYMFSQDVLDIFKQYQQKNGEYEIGGILVGEIYLEHNTVVVKKAIVSKNAKRSFKGVNIDKKEMQRALNKVRVKSDYKWYYLGDWHTHPGPLPKPSLVDMFSYKSTVKKAILVTNFIMFVIVGNDEDIAKAILTEVYFKNE
ncbi:MAG: Mov34/MPN/PAD-1 family protein [Campylobacteraceae bacterium]|jgi:integrative and conjugative element protein (TIGR02256 family)|nr:Mov34/MPN/PAD-1 family protein [Campylobacteraceae bacterium]